MKKIEKSIEAIPDRLWTSQDAAYFLGIPIKTLYQMTYKGTGPKCYKVGKYRRFKPSEVLAWVNAQALKGIA